MWSRNDNHNNKIVKPFSFPAVLVESFSQRIKVQIGELTSRYQMLIKT